MMIEANTLTPDERAVTLLALCELWARCPACLEAKRAAMYAAIQRLVGLFPEPEYQI